MDTDDDTETRETTRPVLFLDRAGLITRWQHGSDAFFWRQERAGRLVPVRHDGMLRYRLNDVLRFEGGLPGADMATAYAVDLMRPEQVAAICNCTPAYIMRNARAGKLPCRRIGRARRFVPAEIARWQQRQWTARPRRVNGKHLRIPENLRDE